MIERSKTALLLLSLSLLTACGTSHSTLEPERQQIRGMENASLVGDLLIGGQPTQESLDRLAREGYRSVVSVRSEDEIDWDEQRHVEATGMSFQRIEMSNPVNEITDDEVEAFARFMDEREGPALLHCGSGNRAAGLWAAWLIEYEGVEPEDAIHLAKKAGMRDSIEAVVQQRVRERKLDGGGD